VGRAITIAYAREGAKVCSDLQPRSKLGTEDDSSEATREFIASSGGKAVFIKVDVEIVEEIEQLVAETVKIYGRLDMYVQSSSPRTPEFCINIYNCRA
jgi:NAD(P)-dependent dehydrogenase (short-subunit alcohol dehydrogenase family)